MLQIEVIDDLSVCRRMWDSFQHGGGLFDDWDYRSCFFDSDVASPHFIVAKKGGEAVGLLPLWRRIDKGYLEFFGGEFMEFNRIFAQDRAVASALIEGISGDYWLAYMPDSQKSLIELSPCCSRFVLDLGKHGRSLDAYLGSFSGKHRKNLRSDLRRLESIGCVVEKNRVEDLDRMVELSVGRFGLRSFLAERWFVEGLRRFVMAARDKGQLQMLSILVGGRAESVQIGLMREKRYSVILGGNSPSVQNIGKLMIVEHIKNAISLGADVVDFLCSDSGWKRLWNLEEEEVFEISNMSDEDYWSREAADGPKDRS